jgi:hypothetical protein
MNATPIARTIRMDNHLPDVRTARPPLVPWRNTLLCARVTVDPSHAGLPLQRTEAGRVRLLPS